jgi:ABC-2 type transport system permease protein
LTAERAEVLDAHPRPRRRGPSVRGDALLRNELRTMFARRRTQAMLAALAAVPVLIGVAVVPADDTSGGGPPFLSRITQNGLFVAFTALAVCIPLFLPLTVGVVAGDAVAGEASLGTLRYLLVAPVGRTRLLAVKAVGIAAFCLAATLVVAVSGAVVGALLFPVGPVTLLSGDVVGLPSALVRSLLVSLYVSVSLLGLGAVGLFISTLTEIPVGAMAATVVVAVVSQVLGGIPQLEPLHPWLFTDRWFGFADLLREPVVWDSLRENALLQAGWAAVFGALAWARFTTRDVLS